MRCLGTHYICLGFEALIIVYLCPAARLLCRVYPTLSLLHHMPGFMGNVLLLPGAYMDITPLSVGQRAKLGGFIRIIMDFHTIQKS